MRTPPWWYQLSTDDPCSRVTTRGECSSHRHGQHMGAEIDKGI